MMKVKTMTMTCCACPSQWEGQMDDGSELYVRYRWGRLTIDVGGDRVLSLVHGDELDGVMYEETLTGIMREHGFTF